MTSSDTEMKERGRSTQINIHNTRSLICAPQVCLKTFCRRKKPSQWKNTHTHTHTHTTHKDFFDLFISSLHFIVGLGTWYIMLYSSCFFLSGFSFTNIHESQDFRGRGRAFL